MLSMAAGDVSQCVYLGSRASKSTPLSVSGTYLSGQCTFKKVCSREPIISDPRTNLSGAPFPPLLGLSSSRWTSRIIRAEEVKAYTPGYFSPFLYGM